MIYGVSGYGFFCFFGPFRSTVRQRRPGRMWGTLGISALNRSFSMVNDESLTIGELTALGRVFEEHRPKLRAMLSRRIDPALHARVDPDDVLNDAFIDARRKWKRFQAEKRMTSYAWLYRIALDRLIEVWRRETRDKRDPHREMAWPERSTIQLGLRLVHSGTSPSDAVARAELKSQIQEAMRMLNQKDQQILWMRHLDQLTNKEAASVLEIEPDNAALRYARALRRLRKVWSELHRDAD